MRKRKGCLQRGRGGWWVWGFGEGEHVQSGLHFCGRFLPVTRGRHAIEEFSAFLEMRRYKNWAHKMGS